MKFINKTMIVKITSNFLKPFLVVVGIMLLCSHDLYLKMDTYFLKPNKEVTLNLFNGTFEESENTITRDRMLDASIVYNGNRMQIDESLWTDKDSTITRFKFTPDEEGTYVTGVSTKARNIELTAEKFNDYLAHDGVLHMLDDRKANNELDQDAVESYQKHVKAIYQVGDIKSDDWKTFLGYPIEFVPVVNPYDKYTGDSLDVQLLLDGQPLSNQLVYANHIQRTNAHQHAEHTHEHDNHSHAEDAEEHTHDDHSPTKDTHTHEHDEKAHSQKHEHEDHSYTHHGEAHTHVDDSHPNDPHMHDHDDQEHTHTHDSKTDSGHTHAQHQQLRTNENGIVTLGLPEDGIYYLRTIHMVKVSDHEELTHESKWATLTFEVTRKHGKDTHTHNHEHEHEGIPTWGFIAGSLVVILLLFFLFRKKD